ncbi:hypothetical protein RRG08_026319 [Elysia crispata]|uniref:Uncharacterized protein n=1 Tax=Elysia crispata TaxID=231223 RepID=A0AAE0ZCE0_9GAST|nr:hypothetical protein RRG08_026319 [Elysia crispata]
MLRYRLGEKKQQGALGYFDERSAHVTINGKNNWFHVWREQSCDHLRSASPLNHHWVLQVSISHRGSCLYFYQANLRYLESYEGDLEIVNDAMRHSDRAIPGNILGKDVEKHQLGGVTTLLFLVIYHLSPPVGRLVNIDDPDPRPRVQSTPVSTRGKKEVEEEVEDEEKWCYRSRPSANRLIYHKHVEELNRMD